MSQKVLAVGEDLLLVVGDVLGSVQDPRGDAPNLRDFRPCRCTVDSSNPSADLPAGRPAVGDAANGRRTVLLSAPEPRWIGLIHLPWALSAATAFVAALGGGDEDGLLAARGQRLFGGPPEVLRGGEFGVPFGIVCSLESETTALSGTVFRTVSARLCHSCQLSATSIASSAPPCAPLRRKRRRQHGTTVVPGHAVGQSAKVIDLPGGEDVAGIAGGHVDQDDPGPVPSSKGEVVDSEDLHRLMPGLEAKRTDKS
ncbi:MAG: hypothetical protein EOP32_41690 [Rhodococcus sp. (in: high G+C Gram-positive bacteria)]|nr:MAG: hypothetical protein EOP32_41690 [Rhodococcus sp. (in: high G+C Gram-positive bacteria)]